MFDLVRTAWRDLETELPDSLSDRGEVGGVDQVDGELLLIADVVEVIAVIETCCSPYYR